MILTIRTDNPEAEIGLLKGNAIVTTMKWTAHRQLAETIHSNVQSMLREKGKTYSDITGIACFAGPGSFTGLRIGLTVGNTLAYALSVPIVAETSPDWIRLATQHLSEGTVNAVALPVYGSEAHITAPRGSSNPK